MLPPSRTVTRGSFLMYSRVLLNTVYSFGSSSSSLTTAHTVAPASCGGRGGK